MKKVHILEVALLSCIIGFYIIFLAIIPNLINIQGTKQAIENFVKDTYSVNLSIGKIKLITGFPLKAGIRIDYINLTTPQKSDNLQLDTISAKADLFPLLFKKIKISDIYINSLKLNTSLSSQGEIGLVQYFLSDKSSSSTNEPVNLYGFSFAEKLPKISLDNILLSLFDKDTKETVNFEVENLLFDKATLNKHFYISTNGKLYRKNSNNINFNVKLDSFMPEITLSNNTENKTTPYHNYIKDFVLYNPITNIDVDMKVSKKDKKITHKGFMNIDNFSVKISQTQLPESYIHLIFDKNKMDIKSDLYISDKEKLSVNSTIKHNQNFDIKGNIDTEKISFENIKNFSSAILNILNIENDLSTLKTDGFITSNLNIVTKKNKFNSSGNLKIINGEIISESHGLFIKNINSTINLENNNLVFKETQININDALIKITSSIDEKSNINFLLTTTKLNLKKLLTPFLTGNSKKNYTINSGFLDINFKLSGKLNDLKATLNATLNGLSLTDNINNIIYTNQNTDISIENDKKSFNGNVKSNSINASLPALKLTAKLPKLSIILTPDKISLAKTTLFINNSNFDISGTLYDYKKKMFLDVLISGLISSNDVKSFIPKEFSSFVTAKGKLPVKASFKENKKLDINAQIFANKQNYINIIETDKLTNKNSIFNVDLSLENNNLDIKHFDIYSTLQNAFSDDFKQNIKTATKIISVDGNIDKFKTIKNITITTSSNIKFKIMNISGYLDGLLNITGDISTPKIKGNLTITNLYAPDYLSKCQIITLKTSDNNINIGLVGANINGSIFDTKLTMKSDLKIPYYIKNITIDAENLDLDKIIEMTAKIQNQPATTSSTVSNSPLIPIKIQKGKANIKTFKTGGIVADNIVSDIQFNNDTIILKNINAKAFKGVLKGDITYNLKSLLLKTKLTGENMDANPLITTFLGIKDQIKGTMNLNADISMKGATQKEQISSLKGNVDFTVTDGQLGSLGKFETYLSAANLAILQITKNTISNIIQTLSPYNSGKIEKGSGHLEFKNGTVYFSPIKTSGKEMSLYIKGNLNMLNNTADIVILGRLKLETVKMLGAISNISAEKILNNTSKFGKISKILFKKLNTIATQSDLDTIPKLTPNTSSQEFKVIMNGSMSSTSFVKSFQWLTTATTFKSTSEKLDEQYKLPQTKEELLNEFKTGLENTAKETLTKTQTQATIKIDEANKKTQETLQTTQKEIQKKIETNKTYNNMKNLGNFIKTTIDEQNKNNQE